jgi:pyruvate dehydrogenase E1 component alpha subunit/2-oxoisovalerate dehydrogenase E1 component alpha subunit
MLGTMIPVLAGMLLGDRLKGLSTVGMTYIGDGGSSTGAFHEGINFAAVQKLPLVLVLEHNGWAYSTPGEKQCAARRMADKAPGYGIEGVTVDGNDPGEVYREVHRAVVKARSGGGPTLVECRTYRMKGHAEHDAQAYVDKNDLEVWKGKDPILRLERDFDARGVHGKADRDELLHAESSLLDEELSIAIAAPLPAPETLLAGVFAEEDRSSKGAA